MNFEFNINSAKIQTTPDPIGFNMNSTDVGGAKTKIQDISQMKVNKAKDIATGQLKQIFMILVSFYFVGSNLSIFSIFFVGMYAYNSLNAVMNVQNVFKNFENQTYSILQYKLLYVLINLFIFGVIIYRINSMGLLPLTPADWISTLENDIPEKLVLNSP